MKRVRNKPAVISSTPVMMTMRGPRASITRPIIGLRTAETRKPNENAPATRPRSQPNSLISGGISRENAVRAVTPMARSSLLLLAAYGLDDHRENAGDH